MRPSPRSWSTRSAARSTLLPSRPRLRRPSQGDAAGHGHPHRWPGHQRRGRPQARERHARPARHGPRVVVTKDETTIVEGGGDNDDVDGRINQIKAEIDNTDSDYDREKLQERLAKLAGGVAVLKVGAATEVELKEKKHRIEDAVSTTKAAIEEGVVAGGGTALLRAQAASAPSSIARGRRADRRQDRGDGARGPVTQIADNAGLEGGVVVDEVRDLEGERASTPRPASTRTSSRPASSTPPR